MKTKLLALLLLTLVGCAADIGEPSKAPVEVGLTGAELFNGTRTFVNSNGGANMQSFTITNLLRDIVMAAEGVPQDPNNVNTWACQAQGSTSSTCSHTIQNQPNKGQVLVYSLANCTSGSNTKACDMGFGIAYAGPLNATLSNGTWFITATWAQQKSVVGHSVGTTGATITVANL